MTQSTLVDSRGSVPSPASRQRRKRPRLPQADYACAFDVLEACAGARSLPDLKEDLVEGLTASLGVRHVSFFAGATHHTVFTDPQPLTEGHTSKMLPEYQERWARHDIFGTPAATRQLVSSGVASLLELGASGSLPMSATSYVRHFLVGSWGMSSATAMKVELPGHHSALVGIFDPDEGKVGPRELATLRLLSSQLSAVSRNLPLTRTASSRIARLSERQREVALLIADGMSNAEIADTLSLAEDSVKKYVSRVLSATGCQSRMELALLVRAR
ncbi:helix-turn-helix transcriptional regulator [Actinomycetospora aeridis]|uniref:LuxR C-terminal-related transcriptional regulator n=1 Tax=Actinomycetospora aeridis TaxID=3129231 RepID=A0ABU8NG31_9PSEU